jgi:hypothetical protein
MKIIYYTKDNKPFNECLTKCPCGKKHMVHSGACHKCEAFVNDDFDKREVECNFPEKNNGQIQ